MRKNRVIEQNKRYHLVSRLAHRAFFLDDEGGRYALPFRSCNVDRLSPK